MDKLVYLYRHTLDADDHGYMSGWEIHSYDETEKLKKRLQELKPAFDDGFEYVSYEWDCETTWNYKRLNAMVYSAVEIDEDTAKKIKMLLPNCEWNRITQLFNEIDDQINDWVDDSGVYDEEDENE